MPANFRETRANHIERNMHINWQKILARYVSSIRRLFSQKFFRMLAKPRVSIHVPLRPQSGNLPMKRH